MSQALNYAQHDYRQSCGAMLAVDSAFIVMAIDHVDKMLKADSSRALKHREIQAIEKSRSELYRAAKRLTAVSKRLDP